jgi:hypothetical protein
MAHHKDYIPESEKDFVPWGINYMLNLTLLVTILKVPPEAVSALGALYNDFETKYSAATNETTRNKLTVAAKNAALKKLKAGIRQLTKEYLISNHLITEEQLLQLGLPVHDTKPTPAQVAKEAPEVDVDTSVSEQVTYLIYQKGAKNRQGKPDDQSGSELVWAILEAPPQDREELTHSEFTTTHTLLVRHKLKDRGKKVYASARWENTRGEKGPWSDIIETVIP